MQPIVSDKKMSDLVDPRVVALRLKVEGDKARKAEDERKARLRAVGIAVK